MADPHQSLSALRQQRARVDLVLVPQFDPAELERLGDVDDGVGRLAGGEERSDASTPSLDAKGGR